MNPLDDTLLLWLFGSLETLGLFSACLVRAGEGSSREAVSQRLFLGLMGVVGAATFFSLGLHPGYWLSCGGVLSLMVMAAVWDPRKTGHVTVW